jgi:hypothetical protein
VVIPRAGWRYTPEISLTHEIAWSGSFIFPMSIIPNLFGVLNMLYLASRSHTHLPLGIHGAILPFILAPIWANVANLKAVWPWRV